MLHRPHLISALLSSVFLLLSACADDTDSEEPAAPPEAVEVLYNRAAALMDAREYKSSVKAFEEVERQHPYSEWAQRAQVMSGFASYKNEEYDDAIAIFQRFVKMHPGSEDASYAFYMIALSYYAQITDVGRDQKITEQSRQALREIINRYPDSDYARDAKLKLDLVIDHLAGKEMQIGRYYLTRQEYLSAINRFIKVIEDYQTTTHVPEALHRLVECYLKLGVTEEAIKYASVLGHNFPDSEWYRYSYDLTKGLAQTAKK